MKLIMLLILSLLIIFNLSVLFANEDKPNVYDGSIGKSNLLDIAKSNQLDIAEVVFRYQIVHRKADAYFLTLFEKDPDEDFLARFKDQKPAIYKGSEFKVGKGLELRVIRMTRAWFVKTKIRVEGMCLEAGLSAVGYTYTVENIDGKWIVTRAVPEWTA